MKDFDYQEDLQKNYAITEKERKAYLDAVIAFFTTGKTPSKNPSLFFASGQPGCGKTELIKMLNKENDGNAIIATFDEIRAMHPNFERASRELNGDVHAALFPDTDLANQFLIKYCQEHKLNLVREATMRRQDDIVLTSEMFRDLGYSVDIRLMAVPKMESYEGMLYRYSQELERGVPARWITREVHDVTYDKIVDTLRYVSSHDIYDRIGIYTRGDIKNGEPPRRIYSSETKEFASPVEALEYGRTHNKKDQTPEFLEETKRLIEIIEAKAPSRIPDLDFIKDFYAKSILGNPEKGLGE